MNILDKINRHFPDAGDVNSMARVGDVIEVLSKDNKYMPEVLEAFGITEVSYKQVIQIGNLKPLLEDVKSVNGQVQKIDLPINFKNIYPKKYFEDGVAWFDFYGVNHPEIMKEEGSDYLCVETRYSAKTDFLDLFDLSKFGNHCVDRQWDDLMDYVMSYIRMHEEDKVISARLVKVQNVEKYLLRAITSQTGYRDYGVNFSIMVMVLFLNHYIQETHEIVYIDNYQVDESHIFLSFVLGKTRRISDKLDLSFNLILENDEIKESAVSMNASFKISYRDNERESYLNVTPGMYKNIGKNYSSDMLTYTHGMSVPKVIERVGKLPDYLSRYIDSVTNQAPHIVNKKNPSELKELIIEKVRAARQEDFKKFRDEVVERLTAMQVNNMFDLFDALRSVEELFGDDIKSRRFWQNKLYNLLLEDGKD